MMASIDYIISGSWQGVLALILFLIGVTLLLFSQISIQSNSSFSGRQNNLSHCIFGCGFIFSAILVIFVALVLGHRPITSDQYQKASAELQKTPQLKPLVQSYFSKHDKLTQIDYYNFQQAYEKVRKDDDMKELLEHAQPDKEVKKSWPALNKPLD